MKRKMFALKTTKNCSRTLCVVVGIAVSMIMSILLSLLLTSLTVNGTISENMSEKIIPVILAISVLVGTLTCTGIGDGKCLPIIGIITISYLALIVGIGILFFDGGFSGFGFSALSTLIGAGIACIIRLKHQKRITNIKKYRK